MISLFFSLARPCNRSLDIGSAKVEEESDDGYRKHKHLSEKPRGRDFEGTERPITIEIENVLHLQYSNVPAESQNNTCRMAEAVGLRPLPKTRAASHRSVAPAPPLQGFGFGPAGPIGGSVAAWLQRRFWGGFVARGGWFAILQRAGMVGCGWGVKSIGGIVSGIIGGVAAAAARARG
ncbi:hypothetical protein BKA70DRAFT_1500220 [Coprinopsis sp. MPI-PUGE-AT-0042]|nr:hypothetical protein BKA70DRAFT_1500220 [Coprinopsis sp. MPI-PUGE-AT-0042]